MWYLFYNTILHCTKTEKCEIVVHFVWAHVESLVESTVELGDKELFGHPNIVPYQTIPYHQVWLYLHKNSIMHLLHISTTNHSLFYDNI